jgi:Mn-dependent DtxR family transcriptional regulator
MNETYEDYLKGIYKISKRNKGGWVSNSEISSFLNVKPSSVTDMLYKLNENNLIKWSPRKSIRMTLKGKTIAQNILRKNNELKKFFKNVLKIKDDLKVKELCCKIEHHITSEIIAALENFNLNNG